VAGVIFVLGLGIYLVERSSNLLRKEPTTPIKPVPNRAMDEGSGVTDVPVVSVEVSSRDPDPKRSTREELKTAPESLPLHGVLSDRLRLRYSRSVNLP
jgi:hypothetical protein